MMDIGLNYLTESDNIVNRYDEVYKFLINKGYVNTLKFPGKYCNYEELKYFMNITKYTKAKMDIHGIPGMVPSICSKDLLTNIDWKRLEEFLINHKDINRISTHLGLDSKDKISNYKHKELKNNFNNNVKVLKRNISKIVGHKIEVGIENIPGGFEFDEKTLKPEFVSNTWKHSDFGVFDVSHAQLAAKELNMLYEDYIKELKYKEKVKILHISGNIDRQNKYKDNPDKHTLIDKSEIKYVIEALKLFKNIDLVDTEYSYNTKYTYEKEIIIEAIVVYTIVKTMNEELSIQVLEYLEENLKEDISNTHKLLEEFWNDKEYLKHKEGINEENCFNCRYKRLGV